jgi:hypothetical protein
VALQVKECIPINITNKEEAEATIEETEVVTEADQEEVTEVVTVAPCNNNFKDLLLCNLDNTDNNSHQDIPNKCHNNLE